MSKQFKSIRNFKFKKIFSIGDVFYCIKILNRGVSSKQFVYLSVYRQLDTPTLTFAEFKGIGDTNLIKLAKSIIKKKPDIFRFFTYNQDNIFFNCYKDAFEKYCQHHFEKTAETITPIIKGFIHFSEIQNVVQSLEAWGKKIGQGEQWGQISTCYMRSSFSSYANCYVECRDLTPGTLGVL